MITTAQTVEFATTAPSEFRKFEQVSIYRLKVRRELDGSVSLITPGSTDTGTGGKTVLHEDGRYVSAMELGQYLRPDGTIVINESGNVLRPDEYFDCNPESDLIPEMELVGVNEHMDDLVAVTEDFEFTSPGLFQPAISFPTWGPTHVPEEFSRENIMKDTIVFPTHGPTLTTDGLSVQTVRTVKTRLGETLRSIALRHLDDVRKWQLLALKNNLSIETDSKGAPLVVLSKGTVLVLPTEDEVENWAPADNAYVKM